MVTKSGGGGSNLVVRRRASFALNLCISKQIILIPYMTSESYFPKAHALDKGAIL